MKLRQAIPILKEFGYFRKNVFDLNYVCQYGDGHNHIRQTIDFSIIESFNTQQELRKFLFSIYNNHVKRLKRKGSLFKTIIPEYLTINGEGK